MAFLSMGICVAFQYEYRDFCEREFTSQEKPYWSWTPNNDIICVGHVLDRAESVIKLLVWGSQEDPKSSNVQSQTGRPPQYSLLISSDFYG